MTGHREALLARFGSSRLVLSPSHCCWPEGEGGRDYLKKGGGGKTTDLEDDSRETPSEKWRGGGASVGEENGLGRKNQKRKIASNKTGRATFQVWRGRRKRGGNLGTFRRCGRKQNKNKDRTNEGK